MTRAKAELRRARFKLLTLSAVVHAEDDSCADQEWIPQTEACERLGVTDRTLRNWAEIGLPTRPGRHGKPLYPYPDIRIWADCYRKRAAAAARWKRPGPSNLSLLEALNEYHIDRSDGFGDNYVVVPNDISSQERARMLMLAAEGLGDSIEESSQADNAWLAENAPRVPRDYTRHDLGWPAGPPQEAS
jgi:hypothetical protein